MGATPWMNRSAKDGARSSLHYGGEGVPVHPSYQGVCGRHGVEDHHVTHGGLVSSVELHRDASVVKDNGSAGPCALAHSGKTSVQPSKASYKVTPKGMLKRCEESESRIVPEPANNRNAGTVQPGAAGGHSKDVRMGEGGSLNGSRSFKWPVSRP